MTTKDWLKLSEVEELARAGASIGRTKLKEMLRLDAQQATPQVERRRFPGCKQYRYGRASVRLFLGLQPEARKPLQISPR